MQSISSIHKRCKDIPFDILSKMNSYKFQNKSNTFSVSSVEKDGSSPINLIILDFQVNEFDIQSQQFSLDYLLCFFKG